MEILINLINQDPDLQIAGEVTSQVGGVGYNTFAQSQEPNIQQVSEVVESRKTGYFIGENIFNLSDKVLSDAEISVLSKGLGFCPTPENINHYELEQDFKDFARRMRYKWFFRGKAVVDDDKYPKFKLKSEWQVPYESWLSNMEVFLSLVWTDISKIQAKGKNYPNLTEGEREALKILSKDTSIVIKQADKGSVVVVWGRNDYLAEAKNHLSNTLVYKEVKMEADTLHKLSQRSNGFFKELHNKNLISKKVLNYMLFPVKNAAKLSKMYFLAKIHKRLYNVPGRPVISNCGGATEKVSEFLEHHLKPIMQSSETYIKDSDDFLEKLNALGEIPQGAILVTADVVGLYPSIPHDEGLQALTEALDKRLDKSITTDLLVEMADFVIKNNFFEFDVRFFQQLEGTAIGTKFAPDYACIFMDKLEKYKLSRQLFRPWWWKRFIDDAFFVWVHGEENLKNFFISFNKLHHSIKWTFELPANSVNVEIFDTLDYVTCLPGNSVHFLDLKLTLQGGKVMSDLYVKPTDCHQYLEFTSCHPRHIKESIVFSQALRIKRKCTLEGNFSDHIEKLRTWFEKRRYPRELVANQVAKTRSYVRSENSLNNRRDSDKLPLVITYHPALANVNKIIRKHFHVLTLNDEARNLFRNCPIVSFRNPKTIGNQVVRAKLPRKDQRRGTFKCGSRRCEVCRNLIETNIFERSHDGKKYKINFEFDCNSNCLIYLMTCKICNKQLCGECTTAWRDRWNNYKDNSRKAIRNEAHMQMGVHAHFKLPDHTSMENDVEVRLIDKTDSMFPKKREDFWIAELKTMHPDGFNVVDWQ